MSFKQTKLDSASRQQDCQPVYIAKHFTSSRTPASMAYIFLHLQVYTNLYIHDLAICN